MKRIISIVIVLMLCFSFATCSTPAAETTPASLPVKTPAATPEPTPKATSTPVPFSYETVFGEIFSDEALSAIYPDIEDYDKERTRISGNIARIEDFEFYELIAEEQEFIKQAQQGNIGESSAEVLREVLMKIFEKDPYVFDDVDNEVKIDNRVDIIYNLYGILGYDMSQYPKQKEVTKEVLTVCNCGNIEGISTTPGNIKYSIEAGANVNQKYFYDFVLPEYESNSWKGNYLVFDFSKFLLDGSEGQKIARNLYEANVKFFNSDKKDVENGLNEIISECLDILLINDASQKQGGINSIDSKMHRAVIYSYCRFIFFSFSSEMKPNNKYKIPNEYAESIGLLNAKVSVKDIDLILMKFLGSRDSIYNKAFEQLEQIQLEKYGNTVEITISGSK